MDESGAVLLELERLRGVVSTGFAEVNGRLDGMAQRTAVTETDIEKLDARLSAVEKRVWKAAGLAGALAIGCSGGLVFVAQSMGH
jgi:hypothetical protein